MEDQYAFGEMDERGKIALKSFAAKPECRSDFQFMPVEGRLYFTRKEAEFRSEGSPRSRIRLAICPIPMSASDPDRTLDLSSRPNVPVSCLVLHLGMES